MWSLRRGIAAAAAGGLRKISPQLVTPLPAHFTCWSPFSGSNYAKNLTASNPRQNNWKLFEDPELPELIKLYDRVCRTCPHTSVGSNEFYPKGKLDKPTNSNMKWGNPTKADTSVGSNEFYPKGKLDKPTASNVTRKLGSPTKADTPMPYSIDKIMSFGSQQTPKKAKINTTPLKSLDKKVALQQNAMGTHSYTINKKSSRFSKRPPKHTTSGTTKPGKDKNIVENPGVSSISHRRSAKPGKDKNIFENPGESSISHRRSAKPGKDKNISENPGESLISHTSRHSKEFLKGQKILKPDPGGRWTAEKLDRARDFADRYFAGRKYLKDFKSYRSGHLLKASRSDFSKKNSFHDTEPEAEWNSEKVLSPGEEGEEPELRRFRKSLFGSVNSSKSNFSTYLSLGNNVPRKSATNAVFSHLFEPIDLEKHKMNFLASHSQKPYATQSVWPKIWPKPLEHRPRNVKSEDPSLKEPAASRQRIAKSKDSALKEPAANRQRIAKSKDPALRKRRKRRLCKATSCQSQSCPLKCFKYHSFALKDFYICDEICGTRSKRAVASQTEALPAGSELCNLCRPNSQPDEPCLTEVRQRQDREALRRYYLRMRQREKSSVTDSESSEGSSSSSRDEMRCELEQCQAALALCGQLVEARLRLYRIKSRNEGCCGVPEPKQS